MDYHPAFWIERTRVQENMSTNCQGPSKRWTVVFSPTRVSEQHVLLISRCFKF